MTKKVKAQSLGKAVTVVSAGVEPEAEPKPLKTLKTAGLASFHKMTISSSKLPVSCNVERGIRLDSDTGGELRLIEPGVRAKRGANRQL